MMTGQEILEALAAHYKADVSQVELALGVLIDDLEENDLAKFKREVRV